MVVEVAVSPGIPGEGLPEIVGAVRVVGFLALLSRPDVVRFATAHGLKRRRLVDAALRLMGNLTDGRDGDGVDRAIALLTRLTPAA